MLYKNNNLKRGWIEIFLPLAIILVVIILIALLHIEWFTTRTSSIIMMFSVLVILSAGSYMCFYRSIKLYAQHCTVVNGFIKKRIDYSKLNYGIIALNIINPARFPVYLPYKFDETSFNGFLSFYAVHTSIVPKTTDNMFNVNGINERFELNNILSTIILNNEYVGKIDFKADVKGELLDILIPLMQGVVAIDLELLYLFKEILLPIFNKNPNKIRVLEYHDLYNTFLKEITYEEALKIISEYTDVDHLVNV